MLSDLLSKIPSPLDQNRIMLENNFDIYNVTKKKQIYFLMMLLFNNNNNNL
jgi:hypothetical protein